MKLNIQGNSIQSIYTEYHNGQFLINRRYQRKLVWSIEEKASFIDSIINEYPVPMILAAEHRGHESSMHYEVLDGMQRLNAIISFIEGEFPIDGCYFNLDVIAFTKQKRESKELQQNTPMLSDEQCSIFINYQIPFCFFVERSPEKLDDIFRRINTGGRTLSKQDVRQAGALGVVPEIINKAAIHIRKDSSHSNTVDLRYIKNISLSNKGLKYGINMFDVFWAKNGIITFENIRKSRDEELVAHLISYMANNSSETSAHYLDQIYDPSTEECICLTREINKIGEDLMLKQFCFVFNELEKTIQNHPSETKFKDIIYTSIPTKITQSYQVIFIAMYKALIVKQMEVINYKNLASSFDGLFNKYLLSMDNDSRWTSHEREELSNSVLGVIRKYFRKKNNPDNIQNIWVANLENILNQSKTEQSCYDFKIGFHSINGGNGKIQDSINKIAKTLIAMTNTKLGECYVLIGIADKKTDAEYYESTYGVESSQYNGFDIFGVNAEADKYHKSLAALDQVIIQSIDNAPISDEFKQKMKSNTSAFDYYDKHIVVMKATRGSSPELYDKKFYSRNLSHVNEVEPTALVSFITEFNMQNKA